MEQQEELEYVITLIKKYMYQDIKDLRLLHKAVFSLIKIIALHEKQINTENYYYQKSKKNNS